MSRTIIFGAGGRAGRAALGEARRRGHRVTAVVRDPAAHRHLEAEGVDLAAGDVTDAGSVGRLARGHDAAVVAVYDPAAVPGEFYPATARALLAALPPAGVRRLVVVGLASLLETAGGTPLMDAPGFPQEYRAFVLGHAAGVEVLREAGAAPDWLVVSPSGDFDHDAPRTGRYVTGPGDPAARISYGDLAVAVLDEIEAPAHHRTHIGVRSS
ncbi:NAD(P)H-binding protein [Streptomyces pactum]|uniref:NAD(P)H-binding protein n=1 Tax=Streptomyces pactum TaxID=68249 RepID=A0ABS0NE72_9ACTN|nr:NAD(P)H-binding protein [Streptomyces pactum]MBH5333453.1 NAD(P)H-binding protein [Streptomyces pactum]